MQPPNCSVKTYTPSYSHSATPLGSIWDDVGEPFHCALFSTSDTTSMEKIARLKTLNEMIISRSLPTRFVLKVPAAAWSFALLPMRSLSSHDIQSPPPFNVPPSDVGQSLEMSDRGTRHSLRRDATHDREYQMATRLATKLVGNSDSCAIESSHTHPARVYVAPRPGDAGIKPNALPAPVGDI
ncbi:hypothetical protein C8Q76DRAFT_803423 [Earliella scabrosa]|nr:hypothetical protein C8Q76DRAFT_803423 [Earliella scabrosa]